MTGKSSLYHCLNLRYLPRSHSFHGKPDKKERKYAAIEKKIHESSLSSSTNHEKLNREETIRREAKSILLTEDNLAPIANKVDKSPDLIQGLPDTLHRTVSASRDTLHEDAAIDITKEDKDDEQKDNEDLEYADVVSDVLDTR